MNIDYILHGRPENGTVFSLVPCLLSHDLSDLISVIDLRLKITLYRRIQVAC